jgi:small subunit ribosomal protein S16
MVPETDARTVLNTERINYWIGVGAKPSDRVAVLLKKYGANGTHLEQQKAAVDRLNNTRRRTTTPPQPTKTETKKPKPTTKSDNETSKNDSV